MFLMNNAVLCSKNGVALCYILTAISVVLKFLSICRVWYIVMDV